MNEPSNTDVPAEWETLVLDFLEGALSDQQFQELRELLCKPEFQQLLANYVLEQSLLCELTRPEEFVKTLNSSLKSIGLPVVRFQEASSGSENTKSLKWTSSRRLVFFAIAAVLLVMLTAPLDFWTSTASQPAADLPQIRFMAGVVSIDNRTTQVGTRLAEGEQINTGSMTSLVHLAYDDGTSVVVAGDSTVVFHHNKNQKRIQIVRGDISASVAPQPEGKPLLLVSDSAIMEVVGTNLAVSTNNKSTRLDVTEGKVKMRERSSGNKADVSAGKYAVANFGESIHVAQQEKVPDTWNVDFEEGLPKGWERGIWERKGLGEGVLGKQSLGAVRQKHSSEDGHYSIFSTKVWSEGLFRIHEDTWLHYRVKMERPEWYQVLVLTRNGEFRVSRMQGAYEYQEDGTHQVAMREVAPNTWRTIHVPLASFKRTVNYPSINMRFSKRPAAPPTIGDVAYLVIFSTQDEDRGLVIDDISVTVGMP